MEIKFLCHIKLYKKGKKNKKTSGQKLLKVLFSTNLNCCLHHWSFFFKIPIDNLSTRWKEIPEKEQLIIQRFKNWGKWNFRPLYKYAWASRRASTVVTFGNAGNQNHSPGGTPGILGFLVTKPNIHIYMDKNFVNIAEIRTPTERFLETNFEFAYCTFFLIHLELKGRTHSYSMVTVVPS